MKVLFFLLHPGYVRNYEGAIRSLAERGHHVHLAFSQPNKQASDRAAERLAESQPGITFGPAPKPSPGGWRDFSSATRGLADYARYVHPDYASAHLLRERVADRLRRVFAKFGPGTRAWALGLLTFLEGRSSARLSRLFVRAFTAFEAVIPVPWRALRFVKSHKPDVVLVTPLVNIASVQVDFLKAAMERGIPNALCVASWDNLTNKGLIRLQPDAVILWNSNQREEAVQMHGIPADRIFVTGAQRFDDWFAQEPSRNRDAFCSEARLDPDKPYLLYLCSSPFIAPREVDFVRRWLQHLRAEGVGELKDVGILIRLHPQNTAQWADVDLSEFGSVSIWPKYGPQPVDTMSRNDFWDSMYHSGAVVGINTSALIEAAIARKNVFTLRDPDFAGTQDGTLHFKYLRYEHGGPLHVANTVPEHLDGLRKALTGSLDDTSHVEEFLRSFLRPHGLDQPATPLLVEAIERLGERPRHRRAAPAVLLRTLLTPSVLVGKARLVLNRLSRSTSVQPQREGAAAGGCLRRRLRRTPLNSKEKLQRARRRKVLRRRARIFGRRPAVRWIARCVLTRRARDRVRQLLRR